MLSHNQTKQGNWPTFPYAQREGLSCLITPGLSKDIRCHVWPYFSKVANHQIRHQATHKVGCPPVDCIWSVQSSTGVCVGMYGLTYSLYHPQGWMDERCFRPLLCTVKAELGRGQPGLMR